MGEGDDFCKDVHLFKKEAGGANVWYDIFLSKISETHWQILIYFVGICSFKKTKTFLKFLFRWFKWALKFSRFFVSSNQNKTDFLKKTRPRSNYRPYHLYNYLALAAKSCRSVFFFINWILNSGGMGNRNPVLLPAAAIKFIKII